MHESPNHEASWRISLLLFCLTFLLNPIAAHGEWNWTDGQGREQTRADLEEVLASHEEWLESGGVSGIRADLAKAILRGVDLRNRNLRAATLSGSDLEDAKLDGVKLGTRTGKVKIHLPIARKPAVLKTASNEGANLSRVKLIGASLQGAEIGAANLRSAVLLHTDLRNADLTGAFLERAWLIEAELEGANLNLSNLDGAIFEPNSLPALRNIARAQNLEQMRYESNPAALIELRNEFRQGGFVEQDRKITFAIRRSGTWQRFLTAGHMLDACLSRRADVRARCDYMVILSNGASAAFETIFFDMTCRYGMEPARPILILIAFSVFMSFVYYLLFAHRLGPFGIYFVYTREDGRRQGLRIHACILSRHPRWKVPFRLAYRELRLFRAYCFFSLLSAFNLGFREVNVGNWIRMLMRDKYDFRARGWARTLSGFQSLTSVYLVALWLLSYFGHPFD